MTSIARTILRLRALIVILSLTATVLAALQLPDARLESDILRYLPQDDPDVVLFEEIGSAFGNNHVAMVALEMDDVFTVQGLELIRDLTRTYQATEGVESVISLTNMMDFKATEDSVEVVKLVDPDAIPRTPEALKALRERALGKETVRGGIISEDGTVALVVANLGSEGRKDLISRELMKQTDARLPEGVKVYYAGMPMTPVSINDLIMEDMKLLIPVVAFVILGVLFAMFRTLRGVILPLATVGLATLWAIGLMTYLGYPITMVSAIMPVVLLAVGSAYGIHMVSRYNEDAHQSSDPAEVVTAAIRAVALPIIAAGLTTFIGFATLSTATMTIIRDFGVLTAVGVILGLGASVTLLPVILSFLPVKTPRPAIEEKQVHGAIDHLLEHFARQVRNRPGLLVVVALVAGLAGAAGIPRITTDVNMLNHFHEDSFPRQSEELLHDRFGGSAPLFIDVKGDMKDPWVLKNLRRFGQKIDSLGGAAQPTSLADVLADLNEVMNGVKRVPDTRTEVGNLWFFLDGQELLEQMVNSGRTRGVLSARVDSHDTPVMGKVAAEVKAMLAESAWGKGVRALPTGEARLDWVLDGVETVHRRRSGEPPFSDERRATLRALLADPGLAVEVTAAEVPPPARAAALAYLGSEEAEIALGEEELSRAEAALGEALSRKPWSEADIAAGLTEALAGTEAAEDPEGIEMMAESLVARIEQKTRRARIAALGEKVSAALGEKAPRKEIEAELWDLIAPESDESGEGEPITTTMEETGLHRILLTLNSALVKNQLESIALALLFVLALMMLQFRSFTGGLLAMIPIAMATLISFGVMAYAGIALDMATAMIASVTIGIGIDYTIHFLTRFKREISEGATVDEAIRTTIKTTGRAILVNTLSVALGFLVLLLSGLIALRHFGLLVALNMFVCAAGALTTLPATIHLTGGRFFGRGAPNTSES
ncbi:MAG: MMPL family transporter [Deltaproteobacteria bacterium]|nr:MMPL family transporter [Deltaproteobacteria bacterium]